MIKKNRVRRVGGRKAVREKEEKDQHLGNDMHVRAPAVRTL